MRLLAACFSLLKSCLSSLRYRRFTRIKIVDIPRAHHFTRTWTLFDFSWELCANDILEIFTSTVHFYTCRWSLESIYCFPLFWTVLYCGCYTIFSTSHTVLVRLAMLGFAGLYLISKRKQHTYRDIWSNQWVAGQTILFPQVFIMFVQV